MSNTRWNGPGFIAKSLTGRAILSAIVVPVALAVCTPQSAMAQVEVARAVVLVMRCANSDAVAELYLNETVAHAPGGPAASIRGRVGGFYHLDLTQAGKGKTITGVQVSMSNDRRYVFVHHAGWTTPPIPVAGGRVNLDQKWAYGMTCGALGSH